MHATRADFTGRCQGCGSRDLVAVRDQHEDGKTFTVYQCMQTNTCGVETRVDLFPEAVSV